MSPPKMGTPIVVSPVNSASSATVTNPATPAADSGTHLTAGTKLGPIAKYLREAFQSGNVAQVEENLKAVADLCRTGQDPALQSNKDDFLLAGGFTLTVLVMEKWKAEVSIQLQGMRVLTNALNRMDRKLTDIGVIEAILASFQDSPSRHYRLVQCLLGKLSREQGAVGRN